MTAMMEIPAAMTSDLTTEMRAALAWTEARIAAIGDELAALAAQIEDATQRNDEAQAAARAASDLEWAIRKGRVSYPFSRATTTPLDLLHETMQTKADLLNQAAREAEKAVNMLGRERGELLDERANLTNLIGALKRALGEPEPDRAAFEPDDEVPF